MLVLGVKPCSNNLTVHPTVFAPSPAGPTHMPPPHSRYSEKSAFWCNFLGMNGAGIALIFIKQIVSISETFWLDKEWTVCGEQGSVICAFWIYLPNHSPSCKTPIRGFLSHPQKEPCNVPFLLCFAPSSGPMLTTKSWALLLNVYVELGGGGGRREGQLASFCAFPSPPPLWTHR